VPGVLSHPLGSVMQQAGAVLAEAITQRCRAVREVASDARSVVFLPAQSQFCGCSLDHAPMDAKQLKEACERLIKTDHQDHEEIIGSLQQAADPDSVPFLRQAVLLKPLLEYLEYDDYGAYYKKCFWALQAIATADAVAVIKAFAESEDEVIREQALYRLHKILKSGE